MNLNALRSSGPAWFHPLPGSERSAQPAFTRAPVALAAGVECELIALDNGAGMRARLLGYGATLVALELPGARGARGHVALGFDDPAQYAAEHPCFGSTIGRFANRIAGARFALDGVDYALEQNDGAHHLHGGTAGFQRRVFVAAPFASEHACGVVFSRASEHGEAGYPGRLELRVRYQLDQHGSLRIDYDATSDRPTVVNLTHHSYFNLRDGGASDVLEHVLWLAADRALAIDAAGIPDGGIEPVRGTALDFTEPRALGDRISQLRARAGYDHCFILPAHDDAALRLAAWLYDPTTRRALELWTTQPALQLYAGNHLDGSLVGHGGVRYRRHAGVCLETQHPPDAPNQPHFASTRLDPGARYAHSLVFRFGQRALNAGL